MRSGIERTARWTAAVRARESEREDRLFDDPWAAALAGSDGSAWLSGRPPESVLPIVIRTRYFDDWLEAVVGPASEAAAAVRQVVLLGAGLDTRAWRTSWPSGTSLFEVDRADVLAEKEAALGGRAASCRRIPVAADLAAGWPVQLEDAGFDRSHAAAWLAEGILFYLPDPAVRDLLARVTSLSAAGSALAFDIPNSAVLASPWTKAWVEMQAAAGAPWIGTMEDPAAELVTLDWEVTVTQPGEPATDYGRWTLPLIPAAARDLPHTWYVTAKRRR